MSFRNLSHEEMNEAEIAEIIKNEIDWVQDGHDISEFKIIEVDKKNHKITIEVEYLVIPEEDYIGIKHY